MFPYVIMHTVMDVDWTGGCVNLSGEEKFLARNREWMVSIVR